MRCALSWASLGKMAENKVADRLCKRCSALLQHHVAKLVVSLSNTPNVILAAGSSHTGLCKERSVFPSVSYCRGNAVVSSWDA